ncbi:sugar ABC transporter permease [Spirochaetia bacterium]|nr:sugar ABC transporter permease [Spirochaetia bacterium]
MSFHKSSIKLILRHLVLIVTVFVIALPFISMIGTAIKEPVVAMTSTSLIPMSLKDVSFSSIYSVLFKTTFSIQLKNSAIISVCTVVFCVIIATFAGYAISRFRGQFFSVYSIMLLVLQMFPTMLMLIPLYLIYSRIGLINTLSSTILSYTALNLAFSIWLLKAFFDTIPIELEEAAMVDGCTQFHAFIRIILPLSQPGIATVSIFAFINSWNEYTLASIFLKKDSVIPMTVGLQKFVQEYSAQWTMLMAAAAIATVPTLLFLFVAQKYLVEGMTMGAVKG